MIRKRGRTTLKAGLQWHTVLDTAAVFDPQDEHGIPTCNLKAGFVVDSSSGEVLSQQSFTSQDEFLAAWQAWVKAYGNGCQAITVIMDPLAELSTSVPAQLTVAEKRMLAMSELDTLYWAESYSPAFSVTSPDSLGGGLPGYPSIIAVPNNWCTRINEGVFSAVSGGHVAVNYLSRGWLCGVLNQHRSAQAGSAVAMHGATRQYAITDGRYHSSAVGRHGNQPDAATEPVVEMDELTSAEWLSVIGKVHPSDCLIEYGQPVEDDTSFLSSQKLVALFPLWAACLLLVCLLGMVCSHRVDTYQHRLSATYAGVPLAITQPVWQLMLGRG
jgi:hypothetical protein